MDYPMRADLKIGNKFPDFELPDYTGEIRKLSLLLRGFPGVLYTFILDRDRTIYKIYNGWWFVGRPTAEEIRMDLRALMSQRHDWVYPRSGKSDGR
ncbi:MAG: hypothetical protein L0287_19240 [Anaerolineae bacterium]|nr:hypothetical protein [Anaerolineae bacterium]MCI0694256.1 hypothetical protein [candidate division KSB1 bacterium]